MSDASEPRRRRVWAASEPCRSRVSAVSENRKKKKKKRHCQTPESGASYPFRCPTRVGHEHDAKNGVSVQPSLQQVGGGGKGSNLNSSMKINLVKLVRYKIPDKINLFLMQGTVNGIKNLT